jgi:hypothetical protein
MLLIPEFHISAQTTPSTVIYVKSNGNDNNNGTSTTTPVKTLGKAYTLLPATGSWDDNYIVVMGTIDIGDVVYALNWCYNMTATPDYAKNVTITGNYGTYTSGGAINFPSNESHEFLWGNTRMTNISITAPGNGIPRLYAQGHDIYMGTGVSINISQKLQYSVTEGTLDKRGVLGNFNNFSIVAGWLNYDNLYSNPDVLPYSQDHVGHITLLSGNYGRVLGGCRTDTKNQETSIYPNSHNIFGHPTKPWNVEITVGGGAEVNLLVGG